MRIALAGSGLLGVNLMKPLLESRHEVVALLQNGRAVRGLARWLLPALGNLFQPESSVTGLARRNKIPIVWIDKMTDEDLAPLAELEPDVLLVGGFSIILKRPILDLPKVGCINTHSSLLPCHRGPNPFVAAIISGDSATGVTFHVVEEGIDTGDILAQFSISIGPDETALTLYERASELAGEHVAEVLDTVADRGLEGTPQDEARATYEKKLTAEQLTISWEKPGAEIDRLARGCYPYMLPRFHYKGKKVYLRCVRFDPKPVAEPPGTVLNATGAVAVATGEGSVWIRNAYTMRPFPWVWPVPWSRPKPGEKLE